MNNNITPYPFVSVIIPTHNRFQILEKTLKSFINQDYSKSKFEIIVIDDGSSDKTKKIFTDVSKSSKKIKFKYFYQTNKGPAGARNLGIKKCKGNIVLIVNDDTIAKNNLITEHLKFHLKYPSEECGVLGYFTWSKDLTITPFMEWLERKGPLFSYSKIKDEKAEWWNLWTCNISFKKNFLIKADLFDEQFPYAAWEDIEYGYRLKNRGFKLYFNKNAIGFHYHPTNLLNTIGRMKKHGASAVVLGEKVKDSDFHPPLSDKKLADKIDLFDRILFVNPIEKIFLNFCIVMENIIILGIIYDILLLHYRIKGRREYLKYNAVKTD